MTVKPIFVSGIGRSGTSAVLASLAEHKSMHKYPRVGEAPFITSFLNFLVDYEDKSPNASYNMVNYRLAEEERIEAAANFMILNQCGRQLEEEAEEKFWITKTSLLEPLFDKAEAVFGEVRCVYVMRNGIEVINSARKFHGFQNLSFSEHCKRWLDNIEGCRYLHGRPLCSIVEHGKLVKAPEETYRKIFEDLQIDYDGAPAKWIASNLFNSSFDTTSKDISTSSIFDKRTSEAWISWSDDERAEFIEKCDSVMQEFGFVRPYAKTDDIEKSDALVETTVESKVASVIPAAAKNNQRTIEEKISPYVSGMCTDRMLPGEFNYLCNISTKYNYVFVNNPKVASTSLLQDLQGFEDAKVAEEMLNPHQRNKSPLKTLSSLSFEEQSRMLTSEEMYRFAFVRDPFSRLLSAYLSKVGKPLAGFKFDSVNKGRNNPPKAKIIKLITGKDIDENTDMSMKIDFQTFIEAVCSQDVIDMDTHWKPQHELLMPDKINYDFIGRFECFAEDYSKLKQSLEIIGGADPEYSSNRTRAQDKLNTFYTPDLQRQVFNKFKVDFEYFNYPQDLGLIEKSVA